MSRGFGLENVSSKAPRSAGLICLGLCRTIRTQSRKYGRETQNNASAESHSSRRVFPGFGRALLRGISNYAHHHAPWSFFWEPGGLENAWPTFKRIEADGYPPKACSGL